MRYAVILLVVLVAVYGVVMWYEQAGNAAEPPLTQAQLAALPNGDLAILVTAGLSRRVFAPGAGRAAWRSLSVPAQQVWALALIETAISEQGLATVIREHAVDDPAPSVADAQAACMAQGLDEAAQALADALATGVVLNAVQGRFRRALAQPQAQAKRTAYLRQHLADLVAP